MSDWTWFLLAAGGVYLYVKNTQFGPGENFAVGGGVTQPSVEAGAAGPGAAIGGAAGGEKGATIGAAIDSVAGTIAGIATTYDLPMNGSEPQPTPNNGFGAVRVQTPSGDGGFTTAYDDAAGDEALSAINARAPLGVVDAKPEQPAFGVSKISPWGGGLYGVVPPAPPKPKDPAYNPRATAVGVQTTGLAPRIGRVGK
jgi:hypothetical protein